MGKIAIFTPETFRFFRDLQKNNRTEWMHKNRKRYEQHVVQPFRELLAALEPLLVGISPGFDLEGKTGRNFSRINRDIRFAKDKSPYRPQMYFMASEPAAKGQERGQLYVGVAMETVTAGFRVYGDRRRGPLAEVTRLRALKHAKWLDTQARKLRRNYESYWHTTEKREWVKYEGWPLKEEEWEQVEAWIVRRKLSPADACKPGFVKHVGKVFMDLTPLWRMASDDQWRP